MDSVLLRNCRFVVTHAKKRVLENVDILIENGKISQIGKSIKGEAEEKIDCSQKIIMPALFNAHTHASMVLFRGYRDDQELQTWLQDIWKVEAKLKPKHIYAGALYACMEMAKSGTWCFVDMYFEEEEVANAVKKVGLTALLGCAIIDAIKGWDLERSKKFIKNVKGSENIIPVLAPHSIYTCSEETLKEVNEFSKEHSLFKTIHLSETRKEVFDCVKKYGKRPVEYLHDLFFLDEKTVIFHGSWVTKNEIKLLGENKVSAVHCPVSNMKLATGGAFPMREYREQGVRIMLGTDGACSNNSLDMFREMKVAALLQKWFRWKGSEVKAEEVLEYTTNSPCACFGLNSGSVEIGKDANLALLDVRHYSLRPLRNVISNIVYSATGNCVSDLLVRGKWIVKDGKLVNLEEEKIIEKMEEAVEDLLGEEK